MKKITFLFLLVLTSICSMAQNPDEKNQNRPRFNKQEFRQRMENYITNEAQLTQEEADAFFPIFNEYKNKQRELNMSIHALKKDTTTCCTKDTEERLMKIAKLNVEIAQLDSVYYKKILKTISADKFIKILGIEDRMHRKMLQNYNRGNAGPKGNNREHGPKGDGKGHAPRGGHRK